MKIVSKYPYLWPHLGFALKAGDNEIDEKKIPLAAHAKLAHLSQPGRDAVGNVVSAPISGYEPSQALINAAEAFSRKSRVKPAVATLETVATKSQPAKDDDSDDDGNLDVELTEESLGRLKYEQLRAVAGKLNVDIAGLQSKRQVIDKLLAPAPAPAAGGG